MNILHDKYPTASDPCVPVPSFMAQILRNRGGGDSLSLPCTHLLAEFSDNISFRSTKVVTLNVLNVSSKNNRNVFRDSGLKERPY